MKLDEAGFRRISSGFRCHDEDVLEAVLSTAERGERISEIREMAIVSVAVRASAAQMLVKLFNGNGLSTPLNQIPSLDKRPPFTLATMRPSALPPPAPTTRTVQTRQRALRSNAPVPVATRYRISRADDPLQANPSRGLWAIICDSPTGYGDSQQTYASGVTICINESLYLPGPPPGFRLHPPTQQLCLY